MNKLFGNRSYVIRSGLSNEYVMDCSQNNDPSKKDTAIIYTYKKGESNQQFLIQQHGNS